MEVNPAEKTIPVIIENVSLKSLFVKAELTGGISLGDGIVQIERKPHNLRDAPVAIHSHVAKQVAGFVIKAQFLPRRNQGAVMKIHAQRIFVSIDGAHIKGFYHKIAQKCLPKIAAIVRVGTPFFDVFAVNAPASFYCPPYDRLRVNARFDHFIVDQSQPCCPVFNLRAVYFASSVHSAWHIGNF
jgi:hypothetical protein